MLPESVESLDVQNPYLRGISLCPVYLGRDIVLSEGASDGMLEAFFDRAASDPYIGPLHLALFMVLVQMAGQSRRLPVRLYSHQGMVQARISSRTTYCRLLNELDKGAYLYYRPSMNYKTASRIWIPGFE